MVGLAPARVNMRALYLIHPDDRPAPAPVPDAGDTIEAPRASSGLGACCGGSWVADTGDVVGDIQPGEQWFVGSWRDCRGGHSFPRREVVCAGPAWVRLSAEATVTSFSDNRGARGPAPGSTESSTSHIVLTTPERESSATCLRATLGLDTWLRPVTRA